MGVPRQREVVWAVQIVRCPPHLLPQVRLWVWEQLPQWICWPEGPSPAPKAPVRSRDLTPPWWAPSLPPVDTLRCTLRYCAPKESSPQDEPQDDERLHQEVVQAWGSEVVLAWVWINRALGGNRTYPSASAAVLGLGCDPLPWPAPESRPERRMLSWEWTSLERNNLHLVLASGRLTFSKLQQTAVAMFSPPWPGLEARARQDQLTTMLPLPAGPSRPRL